MSTSWANRLIQRSIHASIHRTSHQSMHVLQVVVCVLTPWSSSFWSFQLRYRPVIQTTPRGQSHATGPAGEGPPSCSHYKQIKPQAWTSGEAASHQSVSTNNHSKTLSKPRSVLQLALNSPVSNTLSAGFLVQQTSRERRLATRKILLLL